MKFFPIGKKKEDTSNIFPVPNILLRRANNSAVQKIFASEGLWRRTALYATLNSTIRSCPSIFAGLPPVAFNWSEKSIPLSGMATIFCEHGWMPRDGYQISAVGCNQRHPVSAMFDGGTIAGPQDSEHRALARLRARVGEATPPIEFERIPFFLFALQLTSDLNLRRSGLEISEFAGTPDGGLKVLRALSELFATIAPGVRIVFLQHPVEEPRPDAARVLHRDHVYIPKEKKFRFLDLARALACQGVISINSNALNEAILFSRPVFQMGDFLMRRFPNPLFPYTLSEYLADPSGCNEAAKPLEYLTTLMRHQYGLEELSNPFFVRDLIVRELAQGS